MVLGDQRLDNSAPGGVTGYWMANGWRSFLHSRWDAVRISAEAEHDQKCLAQLQRNYETESRYSWASELVRHPLRDAWAESQRLSAHTKDISVPLLSMESLQDEATTSRGDYYQETLDPSRTWWLQTNGGHDLYESLEYRKILVSFLDRFVKGAPNGFERRPHLLVWMDTHSESAGLQGSMEAARPGWQFTNPDLIAQVSPVAFALSQNGRLIEARAFAYGSMRPVQLGIMSSVMSPGPEPIESGMTRRIHRGWCWESCATFRFPRTPTPVVDRSNCLVAGIHWRPLQGGDSARSPRTCGDPSKNAYTPSLWLRYGSGTTTGSGQGLHRHERSMDSPQTSGYLRSPRRAGYMAAEPTSGTRDIHYIHRDQPALRRGRHR
jgi:hypothetical protein